MRTTQGALHYEATIDYARVRQGLDAIRREMASTTNAVQQQTKAMDSSFQNLGAGIAAYFSAQALGGFIQQVVNIRGEFQKTEVAFATMLKSREAAKDLMAQMVDLAAKTPFSLQDVSAGAKQLLAFQVPANEVVDTLRRMGDIAAGLGVPLERINLIYGQVKAKGRLQGEEMLQFMEAGVPMAAELAKKFGVTTAELSKMVSAGKVGFNDVKDVLFGLTNQGGMFFNLMESQSKTLSGQVSNLGDAWDQMLNKIGQSNEGLLSSGISGLTYLVEHYQDVLNILTVLIATYGTYRAALIAMIAIERAQAVMGQVQAFISLAKSITSVKDAQLLFNMAVKANPYVLAATALAALGSALYVYTNRLTEAQELQKRVNDARDQEMQRVIDQKTKIGLLVKQIQNENTSNKQRAILLADIKRLAGGRLDQLTVEAVRTGKATTAINQYIAALERQAKAEAIKNLMIENEQKIFKNKQKIANRDFTAGEKLDAQIFNTGVAKSLGNARFAGSGNDAAAEAANIENKKLISQNKMFSANLAKMGNETVQQSQETTNAISNDIKERAKLQTKANEEIEKIYSINSIKGLQQRIQKLQETIDTTSIGSDAQKKAIAQREALQSKLDEALKNTQKKSFDEELAETERQWKMKYKIAHYYGQEIADAQYPNLKGTYYDAIATQAQKYEDKINSGTKLSSEEIGQWEKLKNILTNLTGEKDPLSNFNDSLDRAIAKIPTLSGQLEFLAQERDRQDNSGTSQGFYAAADAKYQQVLQQQRQMYEQMLKEQETYEEKSANIQKEWDAIKLTKRYKSNPSEAAKIDEGFKKQLGSVSLEAFKKSDLWTAAFGDMTYKSNKYIKQIIAGLEQFKAAQGANLSPTELKELNDTIDKFKADENDNPFTKIAKGLDKFREAKTEADKEAAKKEIANGVNDIQNSFNGAISAVNDLGDAFGGFSEETKEAVSNISNIGNAVLDLAKSILSGNIAGIITGAIKLIASVVKALNGDAKKERNIKKQTAALNAQKAAYDALAFSMERALGSDKYAGQRDMIKNLEQQKIVLQQLKNTEASKKKADQEKINQYNQQIQGINQSIQTLKEDIVKDVLQTDIPNMASKIGDALLDAFGKGENGINAMNAAFDDMIKNILRNQLNKILEKQLAPVYKNILKAAGFDENGNGTFDGLTPQEIADLKAQAAAATQAGQSFIQQYSEIFSGLNDPTKMQGLKGDIKGVTEKTAGALEAQINAIRVNQVAILDVVKNSLIQLNMIEYNTRHLVDIRKDIAELNAKTKNQLAGYP